MKKQSLWRRVLNQFVGGREQPDGRRGHGVLPGTAAGVAVTYDTAMTYAAVWACIKVLSEDIAKVPTYLIDESDNSRARDRESRVDWLLSRQFNPEQTAFEGKQFLMHHANSGGNGYAEIQANTRGEPLWLWPISWERVLPMRMRGGEAIADRGQIRAAVVGELGYQITNYESDSVARAPERPRYLAAASMFHLRGPGFDGLTGYSPMTVHRRTIGGGLALRDMSNAYFSNSGQVGYVVKTEGELTETQKSNLRESFLARRGGPDKAFKPLFAEEGLEIDTLKLSLEDAQFIEGNEFTLLDICRIWRVPPQKVQQFETPRASNLESQERTYVNDSLLAWAVRFEQEADMKLLGAQRQRTHRTRFDFRELLRGNTAERAQFYRDLWDMAALSANDIAAFEGLPPVPNGDARFVPMNLQTVEQALAGDQVDAGAGDQVDDQVDAAEASSAPAAAAQASGVRVLQRYVLQTCAARLVAREANRVEAFAKKRRGAVDLVARDVGSWISKQHRAHVRAELGAAMGSVCEALGVELHAGELDELVERHIVELCHWSRLAAAGELCETDDERTQALLQALEGAAVAKFTQSTGVHHAEA